MNTTYHMNYLLYLLGIKQCLMNYFFSFVDDKDTSDMVAVGLWTDISVRLLRLPNLEEISQVKLGGG